MIGKHCVNVSLNEFSRTEESERVMNLKREAEERVKTNRVPVVKLEWHLDRDKKTKRKDNRSYAAAELQSKIENAVLKINGPSVSPKPRQRNIRITVKKVYETSKNGNLKVDMLLQKNNANSRQQHKLHATTHKKVMSSW
eukprot:TRINITY_DN3651_c0_g3_i1.p5 TRINITY_DN3651_c0_g3~~TRINITY_DN3651_c0_g3_i1.p5  ORF type:complete len:140 (-),score=27.40 TRINITY_DN3651_c0_g3_i1:2452-2871(-)